MSASASFVVQSAPHTAPRAASCFWLRAGAALGFAALTAVCAQISIPLPGTPVPVTLQSLAVVAGATALGGRLAMVGMLIYLFAGLLGAPVFAQAGSGTGVFAGATGGYLVGFILCQPVVGWLVSRRGPAGAGRCLGAAIAGHAVIFACGVGWLRVWAPGTTWSGALEWGLWPFIPGTLVKVVMAAGVGPACSMWRWRRSW